MKNYSRSTAVADSMAGIIVGIVALPLAIAFAIASGVSPEKGIITAIVAGLIISVFGGSKVQIGGPTGAFIVIVYGIIQKFGLEGLALATLMAGVFLIVLGLLRLGTIIKYIQIHFGYRPDDFHHAGQGPFRTDCGECPSRLRWQVGRVFSELRLY